MGSIPGSGRSPREENATHSNILSWKIPWQRSLAGYSPWGCKRVRCDLATKQQTFRLARSRDVKICSLLFILIRYKNLRHFVWIIWQKKTKWGSSKLTFSWNETLRFILPHSYLYGTLLVLKIYSTEFLFLQFIKILNEMYERYLRWTNSYSSYWIFFFFLVGSLERAFIGKSERSSLHADTWFIILNLLLCVKRRKSLF